MNKRVNVILPPTTAAVLDKAAAKGNRGALIDRAIRHFVKIHSRPNLRDRSRQEALVNAGRDVQMAAEWLPLEKSTWFTLTQPPDTRFERLGRPPSFRTTSLARSPPIRHFPRKS